MLMSHPAALCAGADSRERRDQERSYDDAFLHVLAPFRFAAMRMGPRPLRRTYIR